MNKIFAIIGTLPNTLTNGTTADASQVMADFNAIVSAVNSNAAPLANAVFTNIINTFTQRQIGVLAQQAADFPIAMQVQGNMNYGSDAGTPNAFAVHPTPAIAAYADGQPIDFFAANMNGGAATLAVSGLTARPIVDQLGNALSSGQIPKGAAVRVLTDNTNTRFILPSIDPLAIRKPMFTQKGSIVVASGNAVAGSFAPGTDGTFPMWLGSETFGMRAGLFGSGLTLQGNAVNLSMNSSFVKTSGNQLQLNQISLFNAISGDVSTTGTANYFDGPTIANPTTGTWFVSGTVTISGASATNATAKLWDGTTVVSSARGYMAASAQPVAVSVSGVFINPAGNIRISVNTPDAACAIKANASGNGLDSNLTAIRIG